MSVEGVDYSAGRPGGKALADAGMRFAARYLSHNPSKNLTPAEADDLAAHGVSCVVVWETTASRAGAGRAAGIADAKEAAAQAKACGQPAGRPIYFAVDWDANPTVVVPYFQGVASVLGLARTGVYGGYKVVDYLLDHKLATWAWQTVAWSGGRRDSRAVIRQYASTIRINGVECDHDTAMAADYGQWTPGRTPNIEQEEDVQLTDKWTVHKGVWFKTDVTNSIGDWIAYGNGKGEATYNLVKQLVTQVTAQTAAITALAKQLGTGRDVDTIVAAVQQAIADEVIKVDVHVTGDDQPITA
jgi:hypothetical protein